MFDQLWNYVALAGLLVVLVVFWAISIRVVFSDARRRHLPPLDLFYWLALTIMLPMVGALIYGAVQVVEWLVLRSGPEAPPPVPVQLPLADSLDLPQVVPGMFQPAPPAPFLSPAREVSERTYPTQDVGQHPIPPPRPNGDGQSVKPQGGNGHHPDPASTDTSPVSVGPGDAHYQVSVLEGPEAGRSFQISKLPAVIGRSPQAQVRIEIDPALSRQHAELYVDSGGVMRIRDLESMHGTRVNGVAVRDHPVQPGDRIEVGYSVLVIEPRRGGII